MRFIRKTALWLALLCVAAALLTGCCGSGDSAGGKEETQQTEADTQTGTSEAGSGTEGSDAAETGAEKTVTVVITHEDASRREEKYTTHYEKLGDLLRDEELVDGIIGTAGYYVTTADGEEANDRKQEWWMLLKDGEMSQVGVDLTPLEDGSTYELTFTTGYY